MFSQQGLEKLNDDITKDISKINHKSDKDFTTTDITRTSEG